MDVARTPAIKEALKSYEVHWEKERFDQKIEKELIIHEQPKHTSEDEEEEGDDDDSMHLPSINKQQQLKQKQQTSPLKTGPT